MPLLIQFSNSKNWIKGQVGLFTVMSGKILKGDFVSKQGEGVTSYSSLHGIFGVALSTGEEGSSIKVVQSTI